MADAKQYVTHSQENGNLMISEDVIATIVANAVAEVEGVVGLTTKPGADIAELLGKKNWGKGIKVSVGDDGELTIDCNITVCYGQNVVDIAKAAQVAAANALDAMAGAKIAAINVNVCGIVRQ